MVMVLKFQPLNTCMLLYLSQTMYDGFNTLSISNILIFSF